ncbi:MAG: hypothetical protein KY397_00490 [Gemmatimonadetes bacterium]|nr:hypothetical protein [Gemmatimonadota bacterium]
MIYDLRAGRALVDGTTAAGRRIFFGLYRDNLHHLTEEGARLFNAALRWAAAR